VNNSRTVGRDQSHLKMSVTDGWITWDAIAFRQGHWHDHLPSKVDLMYNFELNEYNGRVTLQLNVRDLKPAGQTI
jgi:single-stranded-DNA-specific exonuclease